jgi:antitoxin ParD1/3/4
MNISIHPQLAKFVEEQVKAGHYESTDEMINAALARLQNDSESSAGLTDDLRKEIALGLEEAERGELVEWNPDEIWEEVERRHSEESRAGGKRAG